jgi:predicted TIM-barrel fold metal-dependent hydrolase
MKMTDVHCHVFSDDVLTFGGKILVALGDLISDLIGSGNYNDAENMVKRINAFIEMSENYPSDISKKLFDEYGDDSIIVPLMYDMYYLTHDRQQDINGRIDVIIKSFDDFDKGKTPSLRASLTSIGDKVKEGIVDGALKDASFEIQFQDFKKLKGNKKYRDRIFPFLSFDPRRSGNLDLIKANVGPDKDFRGVKLYPPLGFSAAHPEIMDQKNGLYAYCVANDIPITAHCSCPGMTTLNDKLYVPHDSWVFDDSQGMAVQLTMDEVVDFSDTDSAHKSQYFNHPKIWQVVLDTFPNLRLNLAHFGGDHKDWRDIIAGMIDSNQYQNLFTDISCRYDPNELKDIRSRYDASAALKRRLMYGSDFTILLLYDDLIDYIAKIKAVFPITMHTDIYYENARRFLKLA